MAAEENALIKEFRFIVNYLGQIGNSIIKEGCFRKDCCFFINFNNVQYNRIN